MAELNYRKRGDKWEYRFETAKVDGKRKQISKSGFATKREAIVAGTKALAEYNQAGLHFEPSDISVSDYLDYWLDTYCKMNTKYNTQLGYLSVIENHLKPKFGKYKLCALSTAIIQEYTNSLKVNGYRQNTVVDIISTLSSALNYAVVTLQYIKYNPCDSVKMPKFNEKKGDKRYIITPYIFNQILERFDEKTSFYIPLLIGYYTGLRLSECFALTWDDIDLENKKLTVNKAVQKRNYGVDVRQVYKRKGKKEERSAWYFTQTLCDALRKHHKKQLENELEYGEYYTCIYKKPEKDEKGDTIYRLIEVEKGVECSFERVRLINVRENGQIVSPDSMKYCSRVIHHQLLLDFNYHSLRHTHATLLIEKGVSPKSVQERLGHTSITTTLETYVHDTDTMKKEAVDVFERAVHQ